MSNLNTRTRLLQEIEEHRHSKVVLYATGDRSGLETRIGQDVIDLFVDHLDEIGPVPKISLVLYTSGGSTSAAWNLVNLIRMFCDDFEVIAPSKCMSAGTLISLGADRIIMTKQATLGPIDPTLQHPLGPQVPGMSPDARADVSVEAVNGYLDAVRASNGGGGHEERALLDLSDKVHPLVLGQIFRSRQQIRDLAHRLLEGRVSEGKISQIVEFLCSASGSHDYTINRREASALGLTIDKCSEILYPTLRAVMGSLSEQMRLREPLQMSVFAAATGTVDYQYVRAVIESVDHGGHHFLSVGRMEAAELVNPEHPGIRQPAVRDNRTFEGWRRVDAEH